MRIFRLKPKKSKLFDVEAHNEAVEKAKETTAEENLPKSFNQYLEHNLIMPWEIEKEFGESGTNIRRVGDYYIRMENLARYGDGSNE